MKEVDNVKYYNISEICDLLHNRFSREEIKNYFEARKLLGRIIEDQWYANKEAIDEFEEELDHKTVYFTGLHNINLTKIQSKYHFYIY